MRKTTYRKSVEHIYPETIGLRGKKYYDFLEKLSTEQLYTVNKEVCLRSGVGDDYFMITELGYSRKISKFKNILEWEIKNWNYQEEASLKDFGKPRFGKEYDINKSLYGQWCRFVNVDDRLIYGFLYSLGSYLYYQAEDLLHDLTDELIPHTIDVDFKEDHKLKIHVDANGKEKELKNLQDKTNDYLFSNFYDDISSLINISGIIRVNNFEKPYDSESHIIFCSIEDLRNVSFKHFLRDINSRQISSEILTGVVDAMKLIVHEKFNSFIKEINCE